MALGSTDTLDQIASLLAAASCATCYLNKGSVANSLSGQDFSLWRATGDPVQPAIPGAVADCDNTTAGGMFVAAGLPNRTAPDVNYLAFALMNQGANSGQSQEIHDRLRHYGGLSGTVTTAQTVNLAVTGSSANMVERKGLANYSEVQWWLERYTDTGAASVNATIAVTYDDASSGNIVLTGIGTTVRAGRMLRILSAVAGRCIREVVSVTPSATTGTAGNFGVTATRPLVELPNDVMQRSNKYDWADLPITSVPASFCAMAKVVAAGATTGSLRATAKIIVA